RAVDVLRLTGWNVGEVHAADGASPRDAVVGLRHRQRMPDGVDERRLLEGRREQAPVVGEDGRGELDGIGNSQRAGVHARIIWGGGRGLRGGVQLLRRRAGLRPKPDVRLAIRCVTCESTGKSVIRTAPDTLSARRDVTLVRPPRPRLRLTKGLDGHLAGRRCYRAESPGARSPAPTGRARWPLPFSALEIDVSQAQVSDDDIFGGHEGGKLSVSATRPITQARDLSIAYTPGVAKVSRAIEQEPALAKRYTWADRLVAVVSDGSAVLGLGDIGASASLPVMEGKSVLFKTFAGLDSIPLVLETSDVDEIVETLVRLRPSFGAVNLEDVSAPRCFELEAKLKDALDCPVMHDDQHGTAIVVLAALRGANLVTGRDIGDQRVVISGAGAAGVACTKILQAAGVG